MSKEDSSLDRPIHDRAKFEGFVQAYREDISRPDESLSHPGHPQSLEEKLNEGLTHLDGTVRDLVASLQEAIQDQFHQWEELRDIVDQERRILSDAYQIDVPPNSLSAMVHLRRERHAEAEHALVRAKLDFQSDMERRSLELTLKEKAFEEKTHQWEAAFVEKVTRWEEESQNRHAALQTAENDLRLREEEQESQWISRSEELDAALRQRGQELEASYEIKLQNVIAASEQKLRQLESELEIYKNRLSSEGVRVPAPSAYVPAPTPEPASPVGFTSPAGPEVRPVPQPPTLSNRGAISPSKIVRPIKVSSRRTRT
jgi:hypothetical protein